MKATELRLILEWISDGTDVQVLFIGDAKEPCGILGSRLDGEHQYLCIDHDCELKGDFPGSLDAQPLPPLPAPEPAAEISGHPMSIGGLNPLSALSQEAPWSRSSSVTRPSLRARFKTPSWSLETSSCASPITANLENSPDCATLGSVGANKAGEAGS